MTVCEHSVEYGGAFYVGQKLRSDCPISQQKTLSSRWTGLVIPTSLSQIHLGLILDERRPDYRCLFVSGFGKIQKFQNPITTFFTFEIS